MDNSKKIEIKKFPRKTTLDLNYDLLKVGDIICTTSNSFIAVGIKIATWGLFSAFSLKKCNHVGIVVEIDKKYFICEALSDGFRISSLYGYLNPNKENKNLQICAVMRHKKISNDFTPLINKTAISLAYDFPRYDWHGTLGTTLKFLKESSKKFFCSEACSYIMRIVSEKLAIIESYTNNKIVPAHFQKSKDMVNLTKNILKNKN